ncbi:MAG: hypothetical protein ACFB0C_14765 [Leptolyngbyaceae cyanobacterium]
MTATRLGWASSAVVLALTLVSTAHVQVPTARAQADYETFLAWCENQDAISPAAQQAVSAVLQELVTTDCQDAQTRLSEVVSLSVGTRFSQENAGSLDLAPLTTLPNLELLAVHNQSIERYSALPNISGLQRFYFTTADTGIDLSALFQPLAAAPQLRHLFFYVESAYGPSSDAPASTALDLSSLSQLTQLSSLHLDGNFSDISPLATLTGLTELHLSSLNLDLSTLTGLENLQSLSISLSGISDISPLATLTYLTRLELVNNNIEDLTPLATLVNLTHLNLLSNNVSSVAALAPLDQLTSLTLHRNPICPVESAPQPLSSPSPQPPSRQVPAQPRQPASAPTYPLGKSVAPPELTSTQPTRLTQCAGQFIDWRELLDEQ